VVVNPRQARDFAKATGKLAKSDRLNARALAHFAEAVKPEVRPVPDGQARGLAAILARRRQVVGMLVAERNRLETTTSAVGERIEAHIVFLKAELDDPTGIALGRFGRVRYGGRRTGCCKACRVSALGSQRHCSPTCPSSVHPMASGWPRWWVSRL
jgi:hypothetical protein